jgi:hypothetical protein
MEVAVGTTASPWRIDALCAGLLILVGTVLCMQTFASGDWGARPSTEDEFVYLFQAKTLAAGRLTYPSPPLPEFFEAAHILVVPTFAAKYFPGHAALLAPFQALGAPWIAPCLLLGLTAALLFLAARLAGLSRAGALVAPVLLLGATDVFPFFASYLSQSSSIAAVTALIALAILVERSPSAGRIAALFAMVVFAALVRPFAGVAGLATGGIVLYRLRRHTPVRTLAWALPPLVAGALLVGAICRVTTGSWTTTPWSLYARQYMPYDGPGIGTPPKLSPERELPPHLHDLDVGFRLSRERHTWTRLPAEVVRRIVLLSRLLPSLVVVPFVLAGLVWLRLWPASAFAAAFFLLQLTFHFRARIYYLEMTPWLYLAAAAGAEMAVRAAARLRRPVALGAVTALGAAALWVSVAMASEVREVVSHATERSWTHARWEPVFASLRERHALVFIHYPPDWNGNIELTYNEPDLAHADLIRAIDKGPRNAELLKELPGRPAFVLDAVTLRTERIR